MALLSADGAANRQSFERLCICHPCVYGFGIPLEVDGATFRFCGELCFVGRPVFIVDGDAAVEAAVAAKAATSSPAHAHLRCNICNIEVDHSSSVDGTAFSLDN